ncbi:MAG: electron transport complex subunit E [Oscillospiraceae bacterium]|nr:electron transport complex subunit E [Oscillospiraceae bacterium]
MSKLSIFMKGIIKENPVLVFALGICPALAVSSQAVNAVGMGLATTFVLLCTNTVISLLRKVIPDKVRIPCYIVLTAAFVTITQLIVKAYVHPLYLALGIFLPLITVNCIIMARAEIFAKKNRLFDSVIDALGMGLGFTLALLAIASIREIFGNGTWFGIELPVLAEHNISIFMLAPGGFIAFGILVAIANKVSNGRAAKLKESGCARCPAATACGKGGAA